MGEKNMDTVSTKSKSGSKKRISIHSVPTSAAVLFLAFCLILTFGARYIQDRLPDQIKISKELDNVGQFIGERSQKNLELLTGIGPKVVGSYENEVLAVNFLQQQISFIKQQAHSSQKIEVDLQIVSGNYFLDFSSYGLTNIYRNVQNVVVRLEGANVNSSLLLNSHFDSVPTSPGASDDGISVTTMLETLRVLSQSPERLRHSVIFLFNGAEENPLQAAHGFITQHKWAPQIKAVINLEAAGAGGREIVFQSGPNNPWLMKHYAGSTPRPHGQVIGEEIFQSNLIPSDTDFRLFRDFGNIPGIDIAFFQNGQVYHTAFDTMDRIPEGSYQHIGDNILAMTRSLASSDELFDPESHAEGKLIYFDVFGLFVVSYTKITGIIYHVSLLILLALTVHFCIKNMSQGNSKFQIIKELLISSVVQALGWLLGIFFAVLVAMLLDSVGRSMSWYSRAWLVLPLFVIPAFCGLTLFLVILGSTREIKSLSLGLHAQLHCVAMSLPWAAILIVTTIADLRSSHLFALNVLFPTLTNLLIIVTKYQNTVKRWMYIYISLLIVPALFNMYLVMHLIDLTIPVTGRIGNDKNADIIIAVVGALSCLLTLDFFVPLISLVRKPGRMYFGLLSVTFFTVLLVIFTPLGFPYRVDDSAVVPERYWIFHSERTFHKFDGSVQKHDSGYFILNMDRNSPDSIRDYVDEMKKAKNVTADCDAYLFCGLPIYTSRMYPIVSQSTWIPSKPPVIYIPSSLKLVSQKLMATNIRRLSFTASGPDHMGLYISPKLNVSLHAWSLLDEVPRSLNKWHGRDTYFVMYSYGKQPNEPWTFSLDLKTPPGWASHQPILDIVLTAQYMHEDEHQTSGFRRFLDKFPDWTHVTPWMSTYKAWIY